MKSKAAREGIAKSMHVLLLLSFCYPDELLYSQEEL